MDAIAKVLTLYNNGKSGDIYREAAGRILHNLSSMESMTIYELAEICLASPTTMSRLSKKLGYETFSEFRIDLANSVRSYSNLNRSMPYIPKDSCKETIELYFQTLKDKMEELVINIDACYISQIVKEMDQFSKFSFYAKSHFSIMFLQQDLFMCGKEAVYWSEQADQMQDARMLNSNCLAIVVVPKRVESTYMLEVLKAVKDAGGKVLLISAAVLSIYEKYADYLISFDGTGTMMDTYLLGLCIHILGMEFRKQYLDQV
jgi:DNA-binding MurR/RpiR family transcriptional regulator